MPRLIVTKAPALLVELDRLGIQAGIKAGRIRLHPARRIPSELLERVCGSAADVMAQIENPRRRWRRQAQALIAGRPAQDREDLLHLFDEREAIVSVDAELDDQQAGQTAYATLSACLAEEQR